MRLTPVQQKTKLEFQAKGLPQAVYWRNRMRHVRRVRPTEVANAPQANEGTTTEAYLLELFDGSHLKVVAAKPGDYRIVAAFTPRKLSLNPRPLGATAQQKHLLRPFKGR